MPVHTFKRITLCYLIRLRSVETLAPSRIRNLNIRKCPQQFRLIRMARLDIKLNSTLSPSNRYSGSDEKQGILPRNSKAHQDSKPLNDVRDRGEFCLGPGRSSRQRHKRVDLLFVHGSGSKKIRGNKGQSALGINELRPLFVSLSALFPIG